MGLAVLQTMDGHEKRYTRVIRAAAKVVGSDDALAPYLGVSPKQIARWTSGKDPAPFEAFLVGLDVIALGSLARKRRIRVAVFQRETPRAKK